MLLGGWNGPRAAVAGPDAGQDLTLTARELSDQALRQYQQGQYDAAIESFMGAFALSNNPGLLFNVAQAYRLKGDCEHARDYYQRFLSAVPETPLKASVERRAAEMKTCSESSSATAAAVPRATTAGADAVAATTTTTTAARPSLDLTPPTLEASPKRRAVAWTLRGSAAALLVSSAVFGALSWNAYQDANDAVTMRPAQDAKHRYEIDTALTWTFAATGVACAVLSYFVGRHR